MKYVCLLLVAVLAPVLAAAQQPDATGIEFFEQKIRPVLIQHCYSCHSEDARTSKKLQASLLLDSRQGILAGGESGPVIVTGKSSESAIIKALKYDGLEMPPAGRLPDSVIADFAKWIDMECTTRVPTRQHWSPNAKSMSPKEEDSGRSGQLQWRLRRPSRIQPGATHRSINSSPPNIKSVN